MRLVAWLLFAAGVLLWLRRLDDLDLTLSWAVMLAFSPLVLFETRQIQPDGPMLALLFVSMACLQRFERRDLALGLAALSAAALMKSPAFLALPALWLLNGGRARRLPWFALPVLLWAGWMRWSHHLDVTYNEGIAYFATSLDWREARADVVDLRLLAWSFGSLQPSYVVSGSLFPLVVVGGLLSLRTGRIRAALPFWLWLAGGLALVLVAGRRVYFHPYYALVLLPPFAWFGASSLALLLRTLRSESPPEGSDRVAVSFLLGTLAAAPLLGEGQWISLRGLTLAGILAVASLALARSRYWSRRVFAAALCVALPLALVRAGLDTARAFVTRARFDQWRSFDRDYRPLRQALDCRSGPDELVVTSNTSPWFLYLAGRRGFSDDGAQLARRGLDFYRSRGARLWIRFLPWDEGLPSYLGLGAPLESGTRWQIYCISPDGCPSRCLPPAGHRP
jgi:hypothetical protein